VAVSGRCEAQRVCCCREKPQIGTLVQSDATQLLTVADAATRLNVSRSKLYELLADGELPSVRIGRTRRIAVTALDEFVAAHTERIPARSPA
jgi:excisionase family DNA binding protein